MEIIAHRGGNFNNGENTLTAIKGALKGNADGIEIDLRAVGENIIALHDETVNRTTNGNGHYKSFSTDSIRSLRCKNGDKIPMLQEILNIRQPIKELILEFKESRIEKKVLKILEDCSHLTTGKFQKNITVSSFDAETTQQLSLYSDSWKLAILYKDDFFSAIERARQYGAPDVHAPMDDINKDNITYAHHHNRRVYAFTVNNSRDYTQCLACGVDGVFTDNPEYFAQHSKRQKL